MAELMAKSPCDGLLPLSHGGITLSELDLGPLTMVQPLKGKEEAVGIALGGKLPKPNRTTGKAGARVLWFGRDTYLCTGFTADPIDGAALSDQSDAWAAVSISGEGTEAVLARLVPVDLRGNSFKRGHTCRSLLGHMNVSVTRTAENAFQIMVFRSMAATLVHEVSEAMRLYAARSGI